MPQISATRQVARSAVRAELASVALQQFLSHGFERVTVSDLAAAAGVSRSTFLRYFDTKEDAVLGALDPKGELIAGALRARPASERIWAALRRSLDPLIDEYRQDPAAALNLARLIGQSTALRSGHLDKQQRWRGLLAAAIAERLGVDEAADLRPAVYAAATLEALQIATDRWVTSDGQPDLIALVDEATGLLAPASRRHAANQTLQIT